MSSDEDNDSDPLYKRKIRHSDRKQDNSNSVTEFQYLESDKKKKEKSSSSREKELRKCERVDRAMEMLHMDLDSQLQQTSDLDEWSLGNSTPQRRQLETRRGQGSLNCDPGHGSGLVPLRSQATAESIELSLA